MNARREQQNMARMRAAGGRLTEPLHKKDWPLAKIHSPAALHA